MIATTSLLLGLICGANAAVSAAEAHLAADRVDEVLFALEGQSLAGEDAKAAAAVLARAGDKMLQKDDSLMALQFAQMALKWNDKDPKVHALAARGYKLQQQFGPAEEHGDRWIETSSGSKEAKLFRAQLALEQGDWEKSLALTEGLRPAAMSADEKRLMDVIRTQAAKELKERNAGISTAKSLEKRLEAAVEKAKKLAARRPSGTTASASADHGLEALGGSKDVVLYTTAWCGYCKKAKAFLRSKNIPFVERDVEKEPGAANELAMKAIKAKVEARGVPVLDAGGKLIVGFSEESYSRALR